MDKDNPFNIKVGDTVLCTSTLGRHDLKTATIYTITNLKSGTSLGAFQDTVFCCVKELGREYLLLSRFIPADLAVLEKVIYGL